MTRPETAWDRLDARWRAPFLADLDRPGARLRAHLDAVLLDHGIFRTAWRNRHAVADGVWRGNQPSAGAIARMARDGVRTVINFRGASDWGSYALETDACRRHGIALIDVKLYSRAAPAPHRIHMALDAFERAQRPIFMHCKSGADRVGLGSALYLLWAGRPVAEAQAMLSRRYWHFRGSKTGILDAFLELYARDHAATGIAFRAWVDTVYDQRALKRSFRAKPGASLLVDVVLRRE